MENDFVYDMAVFICRAQPLHRGHCYVIREALSQSRYVTILLGSSFTPRSYRNPWSFEERKEMILNSFPQQTDRIVILPLEDTIYNDTIWIQNVQHLVADAITEKFGESIHYEGKYPVITLIGHSKDQSSYYLKLFPQWASVDVPGYEVDVNKVLSATSIRDIYFDENKALFSIVTSHLPVGTLDFLNKFRNTKAFTDIAEEYAFIQKYKKGWELAPYPPIFVTVDAVVHVSGHILLIERKSFPGKGKWAIPGGFLNQDETIANATIRELKEETKIKLPVPVLKGSIVGTRVFDHPHRSSRGRTITHATLFNLTPDANLPIVKGSDDAKTAVWWPLADIKREIIFEDHLDIITSMMGMI